MRTLILVAILLAAFALVSPVAQTTLSIFLAVVFAIVLFLSIFSDLNDLSYQQKKKDSLNETPDTTELSIPTVTEEADAIVAEVNSTPSDRTNTQ